MKAAIVASLLLPLGLVLFPTALPRPPIPLRYRAVCTQPHEDEDGQLWQGFWRNEREQAQADRERHYDFYGRWHDGRIEVAR